MIGNRLGLDKPRHDEVACALRVRRGAGLGGGAALGCGGGGDAPRARVPRRGWCAI